MAGKHAKPPVNMYKENNMEGTPHPEQQPVTPVIINNMGGYGWNYNIRRRQRFWPHFWLFLSTGGIGNAVYAMYIAAWNKYHHL